MTTVRLYIIQFISVQCVDSRETEEKISKHNYAFSLQKPIRTEGGKE